MFPGGGGLLRNLQNLTVAEEELQRTRYMADSMTKAERRNYRIINESRIRRIAKGSGQSESGVRKFLSHFRQMEGAMGQLGPLLKGASGLDMNNMNIGNMMAQAQKAVSRGKKGKKRGKGPWGRGYF